MPLWSQPQDNQLFTDFTMNSNMKTYNEPSSVTAGSSDIRSNTTDRSTLQPILPIIHFQRLSSDARKPAEKLANYLEENHTRITWDARGNVIYRDKPIEGMNILPILQDISTREVPQKTRFQTKKFLSMMKALNVPEILIQNKVYRAKYRKLPTSPLVIPTHRSKKNKTDPWKHFMN